MKNQNQVQLIDFMGSDEHHALAAWCSTHAELGIELPENLQDRVFTLAEIAQAKSKRKIPALLEFLAKHGHASPFRHSAFSFMMTQEQVTHIHFLKHAVLLEADNGESARYKELEDKAYTPVDWPQEWQSKLQDHTQAGQHLYHQAVKELEPILGRSRAKETARYFLGINNQTNTMRKFSFDGLMQLHQKRGLASPSQREIAWLVEDMLAQVRATGKFEHSFKAFGL
jgi:thymidylate synthase ThyX